MDRKRKEATLASLYDKYFDKIAGYVFVRLGNRAIAEDLAGEVFLKALESLDSYNERGIPMQSWLFKIAHNLVIDYRRKEFRREVVPIDSVQIADDTDIQEMAETSVERERVSKALDQLTPEQRQVIELRFFGELTSDETGKVLNKKSGAVRQMQSSALKSLRRILDADSGSGL
ncbi:sigma-70 family RNA polymerase sigma factor [Chloroflexota bacterium]